MRTVDRVAEFYPPDPWLPVPEGRLAALLGGLARGDDVDVGQLQRSVCEFTRALRDAGAAPEKALVAVKAAAHRAGVARIEAGSGEVATGQIVQWCIREYYRAD